ncbi:MAG: tRNA epoxyqueuosine(34) reductase QueG [Acidobacteriota bacterium]|nr:tRNA epoxyqueuosine(34) reductase QueG [Acidobacteriota bacterium]
MATEDSKEERRLDVGSVLQAGERAGLTACGITPCAPTEHAAHLDAWLARGAHAGMAWMERTADVRKDLRRKWSWARSALVGVASYLTEPKRREELAGLGRYVSRYARGVDYHDTLRLRLARWADEVEAIAGRPHRRALLVDTSAVLERELAVRAGLGWFGKNTCLIGPDGDSWRFIGVVLTDLPLPATGEPLTERCGSCRACLDACPTGAIPEPWFVDAGRCISYFTIEQRGAVPEPFREQLGDWLFGCDVCQEVCPWNRRLEPAADDAFAVSDALSRTGLAELIRMSEVEFRDRFRGTPLTRPKRSGMVRNALTVGANTGDPEVIEAARDLVDDEDPVVAETARWVVSRAGADS